METALFFLVNSEIITLDLLYNITRVAQAQNEHSKKLWKNLISSKGKSIGLESGFTLIRYPIAVSFRLSEADASRLDRLLTRYGVVIGIPGNSVRFRVMLKAIDKKLLSPWDSEEDHDAYQMNKEASQAEEMRFSQWIKQRATVLTKQPEPMESSQKLLESSDLKKLTKQRPLDPTNLADDRNWFTEEEPKSED